MEKILLILVPGYTYLYIILFENTYIFIICHKKWNYSMFKKFELFGSVFLLKKLKRRGRERVKLMIKSHGIVTYCHGNSLLDFCGNPDTIILKAASRHIPSGRHRINTEPVPAEILERMRARDDLRSRDYTSPALQ